MKQKAASPYSLHGDPGKMYHCAFFQLGVHAKRLNPLQAHWALFFIQFQFMVTYQEWQSMMPCHAITTPQTPQCTQNLFSLHSSSLHPSSGTWWRRYKEQMLLSLPCQTAVQWNSMYAHCLDHESCSWCKRLLAQGYQAFDEPQHYYKIHYDNYENHVKACSACAQSRMSHHLPAGLLQTLAVPQRPWFHITVNFIMDLPSLEDNTPIIVAIDRFSKACKLILLRGLPIRDCHSNVPPCLS